MTKRELVAFRKAAIFARLYLDLEFGNDERLRRARTSDVEFIDRVLREAEAKREVESRRAS